MTAVPCGTADVHSRSTMLQDVSREGLITDVATCHWPEAAAVAAGTALLTPAVEQLTDAQPCRGRDEQLESISEATIELK